MPSPGNTSRLFGNPDDFAVEAGVDSIPDSPTSTVWGHMRVWCQGLPLGDINERHCGLFDAKAGLQEAADNLAHRWHEDFAGLDDLAIWDYLDSRLDDDAGASDAEVKLLWKFDFLTNWGEPFNGCKAFLIAPPSSDTLSVLSRPSFGRDPVAGRISRRAFKDAVVEFVAWFDQQQRH